MNPEVELAINLMRLSVTIDRIQGEVGDLIRTPGHPLREQMDALDALWAHTPDVCLALRTLAMHLERGALILAQDEDGNIQPLC